MGCAWSTIQPQIETGNVGLIRDYEIVIRSYPSHRLIARQHSDDSGHFKVRLRPGTYIVRAVWYHDETPFYGKSQIGTVKRNHYSNVALALALLG